MKPFKRKWLSRWITKWQRWRRYLCMEVDRTVLTGTSENCIYLYLYSLISFQMWWPRNKTHNLMNCSTKWYYIATNMWTLKKWHPKVIVESLICTLRSRISPKSSLLSSGTASPLKFWNLVAGICSHTATRAEVKLPWKPEPHFLISKVTTPLKWNWRQFRSEVLCNIIASVTLTFWLR